MPSDVSVLLARVEQMRDECDGEPRMLHTYNASELWETLNGLASAVRLLRQYADEMDERLEAMASVARTFRDGLPDRGRALTPAEVAALHLLNDTDPEAANRG